MADEDSEGSCWLTQALAILIVGILGLLGTFSTYEFEHHSTKRSERAALTSEAKYLCRAIAWQTVYLTSDADPDDWITLLTTKNGQLYVEENETNMDRAWSRPSWFPFRTPVWDSLKNNVGDIGEQDAQVLTRFFNRVAFLNVLHQRRHCYLKAREQFWHIYLCAMSHELEMCGDVRYGLAEKDEATAYQAIAKEIETGACHKPMVTSTKILQECGTDHIGAEGTFGQGPKP